MNDGLDVLVLKMQRDSLRDALLKVLQTRDQEAKTTLAYETARHNFSGAAGIEGRRRLQAMQAASDAEHEARVLLLTLREPPNEPDKRRAEGTSA